MVFFSALCYNYCVLQSGVNTLLSTGVFSFMYYNRIELADNIGFSSFIDEKFKTSFFTIRFITSLSDDSAAANTMGICTLSDSNSCLPSVSEMNRKLSFLYGASIYSFARKRGDVQILGLSSSWINNKYAFGGENVESEMLSIIRDCLFSPNASDGAFNNEAFNITKKDIIDIIDGSINNKRGYALSRAVALAFRGEPAANYCYGTHDQAESVTAESAYKAYQELLRTAQIEISYVSSAPNPDAADMFRNCFSSIDRAPAAVSFKTPSPLKNEPESRSENFDVKQCKVVRIYKSSSDDVFALNVMSTILGETPSSKLFLNVREKLSLCYYCSSTFVASKNALIVDCGVEKDNIPRVEEEISRQINELCCGNISDDELDNTIRLIDNTYESVGDTPHSYASWYFERFCDNEPVCVSDFINKFHKITKERIAAAARSLSLDSSYYMLSKEDPE